MVEPSPERLPPIGTLDAAPDEVVRGALGPLFERAPAFLARLAGERPFGSWARLFAVAEHVARGLPPADQVELLDAHPRIGAAPASVSALSFAEQGYDREPDAAAAAGLLEAQRVAADLVRLNDDYEAHFGFRYVIFVAGRPRSAIVPLLESALAADRADELERGLRDVVAIGRARAAALGIEGEGLA